jgi:phospholipase C
VPAVVISPWCPKNRIEHRTLEHSVVPATIEQLFGVPPLTVRDRALTGLQSLATLPSPRADAPLTLPSATVRPVVEMAAAAAPDLSAPLDTVKSDWAPSLLRIAVKHHLEAAPADSASIVAQVNAIKTVGDLHQYMDKAAAVVTTKKAESRILRVAAWGAPVAAPVAAAEPASAAAPVAAGP